MGSKRQEYGEGPHTVLTEDKRWPSPETRSPEWLKSHREKEILFDWLH